MYFRVNFEVRSGYGGPFLSVTVRSGPFLLVKAPPSYNNRNGPERTGMDRNAPEWASITGMDIKINLFYAI